MKYNIEKRTRMAEQVAEVVKEAIEKEVGKGTDRGRGNGDAGRITRNWTTSVEMLLENADGEAETEMGVAVAVGWNINASEKR